jgi:kynurenine 3-monooxygenase
MDTNRRPPIAIIGAGLAGCFLAILLAERGYRVEIYERASRQEVLKRSSKRSYNLTIYGYAVAALREAGLWPELEALFLPIEESVTFMARQKDSGPIRSRFDGALPYYAVARAPLLEALVRAAERHPLVTFSFGTPLLSIDRLRKTITVRDAGSGICSTLTCEAVFGADGINSLVRPLMQQGQETDHRQSFLDWEYRQVVLSRESAVRLGLKERTAYAWTGRHASLVSLPNRDASLAAVLILPRAGRGGSGFGALADADAVESFVRKNFPALVPALPDISASVLANRTGRFAFLRTSPWYWEDFAAVLGDAAHGFPPFYGQGVSAAFGDCLGLARLAERYDGDWRRVFPAYQKLRKKHMDVLGELSVQGLSRHCRHRRADYAAVLDKADSLLHRLFPRTFLPPLFVIVARDPGRSADALRRHRRQRMFLRFVGVPLAAAAIVASVRAAESLGKPASSVFRTE